MKIVLILKRLSSFKTLFINQNQNINKKNQKNKKLSESDGESGFTLVELMVVVVIVSLLAAIAIPAYSHYTRRAKVTEGLILVNPVKLAVSEYIVDHNQARITGASNAAVGLAAPSDLKGRNVQSITVEDNGTVRVDFKDALGTLFFVPQYDIKTGNIQWQCTYPEGSSMAEEAPRDCAAHA